jgi:hypothetical protein
LPAVLLPVLGGGIVVQTGDVIGIQLMDAGSYAVPRQQPLADGSGVAETALRAALGEPGLRTQQLFEPFHAGDVLLKFVDLDFRTADVQPAAGIVMEVDRQIGPLSLRDQRVEPFFQRRVLRGQRRVGGLAPVPIEIHAAQVESRAAPRHAVFVGYRHDVHAIPIEVSPGVVVALQQSPDQPLDDPIAAGLPRVGPRAKQDAVRRIRLADANDFQLPLLDRPADGRDLHQGMAPDVGLQLVEVGQAIRLQASHVQRRALQVNAKPEPVRFRRLGRDRSPVFAVVGDERDRGFGNRLAEHSVPDIGERAQDERQVGTRLGLDAKQPMPVGPIRRRSLVVVDQMHPHAAVRHDLPP